MRDPAVLIDRDDADRHRVEDRIEKLRDSQIAAGHLDQLLVGIGQLGVLVGELVFKFYILTLQAVNNAVK